MHALPTSTSCLVLSFLFLLQVSIAQDDGVASIGSSTITTTIANGVCTQSYRAVGGSCVNKGYWQYGDDAARYNCQKWGCSYGAGLIADGYEYCGGTPSCATIYPGNNGLCELQQPVCVCNDGYKYYAGSCQSAVCDGQHAAGETWYSSDDPGVQRTRYTCQADGSVKSRIICPGGASVLIDGRCTRPGIPPP